MRALSAEMVKLAAQDLRIERLDVQQDVAQEMFKDSKYKSEQLPSISQQTNGRVTLYRLGDHIDISRGPMVASTSFLGKCVISAAHKVAEEGPSGAFYRIQGVALPSGFQLNHVAFGVLEERSKKPVSISTFFDKELCHKFKTHFRAPHDCPMNHLRNNNNCNYLKTFFNI